MKATGGRAQPGRVRTFVGVVLCGAAVLAASSSSIAQDEAAAATESLYVIEHLVVSVNAAADGSGERVGQIQSGDKVEVLERQGDQARVRLSSGNEGWVRTSYLSQTPPMRDQLKARTDEVEKLRQEKSKLEAELTTARKAATEAVAAARAATPPEATPPPAAVAAAAEPAPSQSAPSESASDTSQASTPPLFASEGMMPRRPSWIFALVAAAAALAIGFALGWRMLDRRIRAKYGGLRIY